jgi:hypothetical protein
MIEFIIKDIDDHAVQTNWLVVECVTCSELNLIPTGKNIRLQNYGTYLVKEQLDGKDYNQIKLSVTRTSQAKSQLNNVYNAQKL